MPIYEYRCAKCGTFEVTQRITESPLKKCPTCKNKVERLISATSFVLKGSGWYASDYARPKTSGTDSKADTSKTDTASKPATDSSASSTATSTPSESKSTTDSTSAKPAA